MADGCHIVRTLDSSIRQDFDDDQSGLLTFEELKSGVRDRLKIKAKGAHTHDARTHSSWRCLWLSSSAPLGRAISLVRSAWWCCSELPDIELKALWVVLDADDSGFIESSEFQKFMQRDAPPPITAEKRAELLKSKRKTERNLQQVRTVN